VRSAGIQLPRPVDLIAARVFFSAMNAMSSRPLPARPLALPNILTYARIGAVPVVVALIFWQSIFDGPLWLRWLALAIFISAGVTDVRVSVVSKTEDSKSGASGWIDEKALAPTIRTASVNLESKPIRRNSQAAKVDPESKSVRHKKRVVTEIGTPATSAPAPVAKQQPPGGIKRADGCESGFPGFKKRCVSLPDLFRSSRAAHPRSANICGSPSSSRYS